VTGFLKQEEMQPAYRVVESVLVVVAGRALIVKKVFSLKPKKQRRRIPGVFDKSYIWAENSALDEWGVA
jgi:hypothetical protein